MMRQSRAQEVVIIIKDTGSTNCFLNFINARDFIEPSRKASLVDFSGKTNQGLTEANIIWVLDFYYSEKLH